MSSNALETLTSACAQRASLGDAKSRTSAHKPRQQLRRSLRLEPPTVHSLTRVPGVACSAHGALLACMREFMRWMSRTGVASEHMGAIIHAVLFNLGSSWSADYAAELIDQPINSASVAIEVCALQTERVDEACGSWWHPKASAHPSGAVSTPTLTRETPQAE